ncbi:alpha-ketoglutarate decarboxylase [Seonamhaeicola maritimus]|uniref:Alpha-ketoglutarate decarboxylase n=1 Tax=Seonamhaeicola maritimus TaxID=2591822 RepID=A0A5C7GIL4_9FLAO|nr:alpha-ketoglutarate decarboxylase [Seonamhaeicola maritimus]TXG37426.1 alpha-ketoglutarate decarboxylase [Seonamhaeicola maritimus]
MQFSSFYKKTLIILLVSLFCFQTITAQKNKDDFWNNVRYGGGLGLNFGDGFFSGTIAPSAIYEFNHNFALGLGLNATFNNQKGLYKSNILGGSLISLFNVINEVQISAEYEQLHVNRRYDVHLNLADDNFWSPALYLGAGYRSGNVVFGIRYDLLYNENRSIYSDSWVPFVRFYF